MTKQILLINFGVLILFMSAGYAEALSKKRLDTVDVCWGLGFILLAWLVLAQAPSNRSLLAAVLVSIWGVRLAWHIHNRHKNKPDDPRYQEITSKWQGDIWRQAYYKIFLLQGLLIWIVSLPLVMLANDEITGKTWLVVVGAAIWLLGFLTEAIADRQLKTFLLQKDRPKIMQTGLWRYSRHPNYFGELTQWWGIGVMALSASYGWVGLAGPLVLSYLMIFVSGIPPIERKKANDKDYQAYKRQTSPLIPLPPRR